MFAAWDIVNDLLAKTAGDRDALFGGLGGIPYRRTAQANSIPERERQAPALFRAGLAKGSIQFAVRGDRHDWQMPDEIWTTQPLNAQQLPAANGGPLERSLFLPIYSAELNDAEQKFAVYLDNDDAVRWWHRNGTMRSSYSLRGWRRGNVYPDFLFAALKEAGGA